MHIRHAALFGHIPYPNSNIQQGISQLLHARAIARCNGTHGSSKRTVGLDPGHDANTDANTSASAFDAHANTDDYAVASTSASAVDAHACANACANARANASDARASASNINETADKWLELIRKDELKKCLGQIRCAGFAETKRASCLTCFRDGEHRHTARATILFFHPNSSPPHNAILPPDTILHPQDSSLVLSLPLARPLPIVNHFLQTPALALRTPSGYRPPLVPPTCSAANSQCEKRQCDEHPGTRTCRGLARGGSRALGGRPELAEKVRPTARRRLGTPEVESEYERTFRGSSGEAEWV
jgi:hypothetical protein